MEASKVIHAFYTDDEVLLDAVKAVKQITIISKKYFVLSQFMD